LEVLGYRHIVELAVAGGLADDVRSIEARALAAFFADDGMLDPELQSYFSQFAIILSFLYDPEGVFAANIRRCSKAQFIAGPHRPDEAASIHATEVFLQPLQRLAIFDADPVPSLNLDGAAPESSATTETKVVALHPGSGSEHKNWPEEQWTQLLHHLVNETPHRFLLIGGEAEVERVQRLATLVPVSRLDTAFQLPLSALARRLTQARLLIGHDSGISHLAAALGTSVIVLWGHTSEAIWRPRSPRVRIVRGPQGLAGLPVAQVLREIEAGANA
jgi:heptosyltransferase-2